MKYLGINIGHDASIAIVSSNYEIDFAISEERLNRKKNYFGFPYLSLKYVPAGKYIVSISNSKESWQNYEKRYLNLLFNDDLSKNMNPIINRDWFYSFQSKKKEFKEDIIKRILDNHSITFDSLNFYDHHLCHAASAAYSTNYKNAIIFTSDGAGDNKSSTVYSFSNNQLKLLESTYLPNSAGHMYSWATKFLGYKIGRHEGKLTGLAGFGNSKIIKKLSNILIEYNDKSRSFINLFHQTQISNTYHRIKNFILKKPFFENYEKFAKFIRQYHFSDKNLALLVQLNLEKSVLDWIKFNLKNQNHIDIGLAGGVFANVRLNQKISQISKIKNLWVFPEMGDSGLSVGASYLSVSKYNELNDRNFLSTMYLGPKFSTKDFLKKEYKSYFKLNKINNPGKKIAELLNDNQIVGIFIGRMEFGPRALGGRSILASPKDKSLNQTLNKRLNRTEFMPFAPCVIEEYIKDIFDISENIKNCLEYMTVTCDVRKEWRDKIQATVHVDNTARPQVVIKNKQKFYWNIIFEYYKITGIPVLVNTSFNAHEEPIVCDHSDALRSLKNDVIDYLFFENFMIEKK